MQSIAVVKHGYVVQHILLRVEPGLVISPVDPLLFQASEETFCNRVIPAITFAALRSQHPDPYINNSWYMQPPPRELMLHNLV